MLEWYSHRPGTHRLPPLRVANIKGDAGWKELVGKVVKAANTRAAAPMFRDFVTEHFVDTAGIEVDIVRIAVALDEFYKLLYGAPMFMEPDDIDQLRMLCSEIGLLMMKLRETCRRQSKLCWRLTPKIHKLAAHVHLYAQVFNPRYIQNYQEESLIGTTCRVWQRAMRGRYRAFAQKNVLLRRFLGLLLRLEFDF